MRSKAIVWKQYDNLNEQINNIIITPKGQILTISSMSHDYYLCYLFEKEFLVSDADMYRLKQEARELLGHYVRDVSIIIAKYGYISVHTSGIGLGWIQGPKNLNESQMKAIQLEYSLGNLSPLLYDIFSHYTQLINEACYFGEKPWFMPYQIDIEFVKEARPWHTENDVKNGYSVSIL